ncbi:MAG: hypothetical protein JO027_01525 [Solirubrobacterales bacterium]|nr:hypothetical protein [Solirubrobacterales bacterium]
MATASTAASTVVSSVQVRRARDRARQRKPLRLQITRRRAGQRGGAQKFVTQVRFGGREAVVVPWAPRALADGLDAPGVATEG